MLISIWTDIIKKFKYIRKKTFHFIQFITLDVKGTFWQQFYLKKILIFFGQPLPAFSFAAVRHWACTVCTMCICLFVNLPRARLDLKCYLRVCWSFLTRAYKRSLLLLLLGIFSVSVRIDPERNASIHSWHVVVAGYGQTDIVVPFMLAVFVYAWKPGTGYIYILNWFSIPGMYAAIYVGGLSNSSRSLHCHRHLILLLPSKVELFIHLLTAVNLPAYPVWPTSAAAWFSTRQANEIKVKRVFRKICSSTEHRVAGLHWSS